MNAPLDSQPWYHGVTRYQWTVLLIASLGWVFDIFEGQIFVASMNEAMDSLTPEGTSKGTKDYYKNVTFAFFLLGGATGGVVFGMLSDRIGRKKTMTLTIVMYSLFTCVSAFSQEWWHMAIFRFLVAMGVGGEWAVASSFVAEVFPERARARVSGIFHASSVLGTWLATAVATILIGNAAIQSYAESIGYPTLPWRIGFGLGVFPALLIIWIRRSLKEPESWEQAKERAAAVIAVCPECGERLTEHFVNCPVCGVPLTEESHAAEAMGRIPDLFRGEYLRPTLVGVSLAAIGMATFWGAHVFGKNLLRRDYAKAVVAEHTVASDPDAPSVRVASVVEQQRKKILADNAAAIKRWEMLGMFLVTTGGGLGLLSFGPLCERFGRKATFLGFHLGGLAASLIAFQLLHGIAVLCVALPVFGFLTLGMHAGYAIYFPELYPTRMRGTGAGFCFNFGRILAAPILVLAGKLQEEPPEDGGPWDVFALGLPLENAASLLCLLFLAGVLVLVFAPETKGRELPR
jgi:MFS family permease